jgi:copper(I)-binding protein
MTLTSTKGTKLLGFASPVANSSQLHEMTMAGDVMQMREVASLALPAGQAVSLKPGGHHLMLIGLKKVLKSGDHVPLQLKLQAADGRLYRQSLTVPVAAKQP